MSFPAVSRVVPVLVGLAAATACARQAAVDDSRRTPIACRLDALTATERLMHTELMRDVGAMTAGVREVGDGYALTLRADAAGFERVAKWISLERRCCPFLRFALRWAGGDALPILEVGGGPGVKEFLAAELVAPSRT